jgi:Ca2+-binding EF-hand superfamily protein
LSYALVKARIVDADFVQRLRADFKALDVTDQGVLSEKDLREGLNQLRDDFTLAATVAADIVERRSSDGSLSSGFSEALEANAGESMRLPVLNKPQQGEENHV